MNSRSKRSLNIISSLAIFGCAVSYGALLCAPNRAGLWRDIAWIVAALLLHDAYFYWCHRLLHRPWLYRKVHIQHHLPRTIHVPDAFHLHPVESCIEALFIPMAAAIGQPSMLSFCFMVLVMMGANVAGHWGGIDLGNQSKFHLLTRLFNTPTRHLGHHLNPSSNYGAYLPFWDMTMGTVASKPKHSSQSSRRRVAVALHATGADSAHESIRN